MIGILLAAGRGTRMKSEKPKVLFDVNDEPLAFASLKALLEICDRVVLVVGYRGEDVKRALISRAEEVFGPEQVARKLVTFTQDPPRGTGDAVRVAVEGLGKKGIVADSEIVVVNGDLPLIRSKTVERLIKLARQAKVASAVASVVMRNPQGLGRIIRNSMGAFSRIVEEKDAGPDERKVKEINTGVYYFQGPLLMQGLAKLNSNNAQGEFYLTDLLGASHNPSHSRSEAFFFKNKFDFSGVNNTYELSLVRKIAQARLQRDLCEEKGVDFMDPFNTWISARAKFEGRAEIGPGVCIRGKSSIGVDVVLEGQNLIRSSKILAGARIKWGSVVDESEIGSHSQVGPMAHLRPGSILGEDVRVGNFVELKKTRMHRASKAAHLSYLGDATIGEEANIGCGTITCNYDGVNKFPTVVGKRAFIGSDSQLVAPVTVGDDAYVASGTTVTEDVPAGALALARPEMVIKPDYAAKLQAKLNKVKGS